MSLGREYGSNFSDFKDSWASPLVEWHMPQFADEEAGGGPSNFYDEIFGHSDSVENTEDRPGDEVETISAEEKDELIEPTMSYEDALREAINIDEQITRHLEGE